jgi:hypothetical protein
MIAPLKAIRTHASMLKCGLLSEVATTFWDADGNHQQIVLPVTLAEEMARSILTEIEGPQSRGKLN